MALPTLGGGPAAGEAAAVLALRTGQRGGLADDNGPAPVAGGSGGSHGAAGEEEQQQEEEAEAGPGPGPVGGHGRVARPPKPGGKTKGVGTAGQRGGGTAGHAGGRGWSGGHRSTCRGRIKTPTKILRENLVDITQRVQPEVTTWR